jgi:cysteine synthase
MFHVWSNQLDPRGGAVMIAGISVAGRGAATASPLKATKATIRSIVADPASDRKFYTKTVSNMCVAEGDHDTLHTMFE